MSERTLTLLVSLSMSDHIPATMLFLHFEPRFPIFGWPFNYHWVLVESIVQIHRHRVIIVAAAAIGAATTIVVVVTGAGDGGRRDMDIFIAMARFKDNARRGRRRRRCRRYQRRSTDISGGGGSNRRCHSCIQGLECGYGWTDSVTATIVIVVALGAAVLDVVVVTALNGIG